MSLNYYQLFYLQPLFNIALKTLETNYRQIQSEAHPDRFVTATATEKLASMQLATLANEAYQTLKNPASRAKYLLELHGINAINESNTSMPTDFLMQQMQWRETLEDASMAHDISTLEALLSEMQAEAKSLQADLSLWFDERKDYANACETTRKLIFIDKVCADIQQAIDLLD
ncbi:MAG: Fe-S protein assembly co-chaperone HscB [Methylotenera sp.]|nr:Fe-S protein assembly co-chaperone HscB [Methylotenera sp.]MSQ00221.1 Fe-S protein assembly co-chaperone HscB [Methylotenera sp.]